MTPALQIAGRTHVGLVRRRNEDVYYVGTHMAAVADGMGGHVAGDIASSTAIAAIRDWDQAVAADRLAGHLGRAIAKANLALQQRIQAEPETAGMGTTLVTMMWAGDDAVIANIGDSRAYLLRRGAAAAARVARLTEDHLYRYLLAGADEVPGLPEKLSRFLDGRADGRSADLTPIRLRPGDRILLCSDGLSSYVPRAVIEGILAETTHPDRAADNLIAAALEHGGPDNVTVVVIDP